MRGKRRLIVALLAAGVVFSAVFAMAASLGGVTSNRIGADNVAVAACDTDGVTTSYASAWDATDKRYEISTVTVGAVNDACDGQNLSVSLTDSTGAQIGSGTLAIPTNAAVAHTVTLSSAASAKDSQGVHVLITS
jgi:anti-sigma-K factor RskA